MNLIRGGAEASIRFGVFSDIFTRLEWPRHWRSRWNAKDTSCAGPAGVGEVQLAGV